MLANSATKKPAKCHFASAVCAVLRAFRGCLTGEQYTCNLVQCNTLVRLSGQTVALTAVSLARLTYESPPSMIAASRLPLPDYSANLRRLMAREGLTLGELLDRSGLNHQTVKSILGGSKRPHSRTLHRLAAALEVPVEELFQDPALLRHRLFDQQTNPVVEEIVATEPQLFHGWTQAEFDELYSRFGAGGALTSEGTREVAEHMNRRRELLNKAAVLLETNEGELLEGMIEMLYRRAVVAAPTMPTTRSHDPRGNAMS